MFALVSTAFIFLWGCRGNQPREYLQLRGFTQGTTYNILYHHRLSTNFADSVEAILAQIDSSMSLYNQSSTVSKFNRNPNGLLIDPLLAKAVGLSLALTEETSGAFDITVGPLVAVWGFYGKKGELPDSNEIGRLKKLVGPSMINLSGGFLAKSNPDVRIDLNAIAQGFTADVVSEFFEKKGVRDYLVEVGGEVRTLGKSPRGDKWIVGVDKPLDHSVSGENLQVKLALSGQSLATSGSYRKFYIRNGVRYSHTIDPGTGYPVGHSLLSATVLSRTSARADALATAFMVMGVELTQQWLATSDYGDEAYLIYSVPGGELRVWMTEGMKQRVVE